MRQDQLPVASPGMFIRESLSSSSTSCIGAIAVIATDAQASRSSPHTASEPLRPV